MGEVEKKINGEKLSGEIETSPAFDGHLSGEIIIPPAFNGYLSGEIEIPPDKSISHRAIIFGALTKSKIKIKNFSQGQDCLRTLEIFKQLGAKAEFIVNSNNCSQRTLVLDAKDIFKIFKNPQNNFRFNCGNSGTTTRLLLGLFSGLAPSEYVPSKSAPSEYTFFGDESLSKRPMKRVIEPLEQMGAKIISTENKLPITVFGQKLKPIEYVSPIPSAQVKSCLLLAGLTVDRQAGKTRIYEKTLSRNHSELMLEYLGASIKNGRDEKGYFVEIENSPLVPKDIEIAGDISSAAFFMVAAAIIPSSKILIKNVGINPTRTGILDVFEQAGINYNVLNKKTLSNEPVADISVQYTPHIKPIRIEGDIIPRLIDEIPILAILMTQAQGKSCVKNAKDLRNKESDRITTIVETLKKLDFKVEEFEDGFEINNSENSCKNLIDKEVELQTYLDHRLAMSYYVLSLLNKKKTRIIGADCINTSFPEFFELFKSLLRAC